MAQAPVYSQGIYAGNPNAIHPDNIQFHAQALNHHNEPVVIVQPPVYQRTRASPADPVSDYMGYSIFTTLCCCICLGGAAIMFSRSARKANADGRRAEAASSSHTALILNHIGVVVGLICIVIFCLNQFYFKENYP
ncbi:hypothetical protein DPX16_6818 [Anabarilius grahami]|uniref:Synapse differentiation-inducing gene protein 1-like n=1 Tax=Anabarilius grahami TaxID=495550 RepID=A0A3N0Y6E8_ANAGA|nr:hypothetical protein DPX16_6818 [Anabarilius grahami]